MIILAVSAAWILVSLSMWRMHKYLVATAYDRGYGAAAALAINVHKDIDQL